MTDPLRLTGISKRFGSVVALQRVDFRVAPGEIHALLGENGAGKSTLMKVAFGLTRPEAGTITLAGVEYPFVTPVIARRHGVGMVHQHFTAIPALSVLENVTLAAGWRPGRSAWLRLRDTMSEAGITLDPDTRAGDLSAGQKQRLEVLQALAGKTSVLLLDEPSSVLSPPDAEALLDLVRRMRDRGVAAVLITHKLGEALEYGDSVTVLRRGAVAFTGPADQVTRHVLIQHTLGDAPPAPVTPPRCNPGAVRLEVANLSVDPLGGTGTGLRQATLQLRAGELVGVAALEGNGHRELLRCLAGLVPSSGGSLQRSGVVSFIPEDRTTEGLIGEFSLTRNVALIRGTPAPWLAGPWIDWSQASQHTASLLARHAISALGPDALAGSLSGGNQQRLLIAEALARDPAILIAENPTRGLDVQAATLVSQRLGEAAAAGVAVLVFHPDLDELLSIATRILVLAGGRLHEAKVGATRDEIGRLMLGEPDAA